MASDTFCWNERWYMASIRGFFRGIIGRIKRGRVIPPREWRWGYRCEYIDDSTGEVISSTFRVVTTDSPANYQAASRKARAEALEVMPRYVGVQLINSGRVSIRCRRKGDIEAVP